MNIYVGNLPKNTTVEAVKTRFEEYGEVQEVTLPKDQYSGELRGFGFINMPGKEAANKAIQEINSTEFEGRTIIVNEARPKKGGRSGGSRGGGGGYNKSRY